MRNRTYTIKELNNVVGEEELEYDRLNIYINDYTEPNLELLDPLRPLI